MNQRLEKVKEFMQMFGQSVATEPTIPDYHVRELRHELLDEELSEFNSALHIDDTNEIADAIIDMAYVHYGTMLAFGITSLGDATYDDKDIDYCCLYIGDANRFIIFSEHPYGYIDEINVAINTLAKRLLPEGKFEALFNEVHRSNMSKFCKTIEEARETQSYYLEKGIKSNIVEKDSAFVVYSENGKVLKSINYSPANLKQILAS